MAKLSDMHRLIGYYLELNGDKDVTSISSVHGDETVEYELNLHDLYSGPIGTNPYRHPDRIRIPRVDKTLYDKNK